MMPPSRFDRKILQTILLGFLAFILAMTVLAIYNNSFRAAPIFIFLLFLGTGSTLFLGTLRGGAIALVLLVIWITVKQNIGVWTNSHTLTNLVELIGLILLFVLSGWYGNTQQSLLEAYHQNQLKLEQFNLEDKRIGLIKPSIGQLRLREEEERSVRYKRPFSLILIMIQPGEDIVWGGEEEVSFLRAVANTVKISSRRTDIPFMVEPNTIGLMLPETSMEGANRVVHTLIQNMLDAEYLDPLQGKKIRLEEHLQIRYGFAAFLGLSHEPIDMLSAAKSSLQKNMEINAEPVYQNVFMEWKEIGEHSFSSPLLKEESVPS